MLLFVLAFREDFEQEGVLLLNEPLDLVGVDLGRHPNMLARSPGRPVHGEEVVADDVLIEVDEVLHVQRDALA